MQELGIFLGVIVFVLFTVSAVIFGLPWVESVATRNSRKAISYMCEDIKRGNSWKCDEYYYTKDATDKGE